MSINVTVTGNPISITKGQLLTPRSAKDDFDKRRLIRISQVRQQSKDIAENIRKKVQNEKLKHVAHIEQEGFQKLKHWQSRKLLDLQNQYHNALKDIGTAYKDAENFEDEERNLKEKKRTFAKTAKKRNNKAAHKLHEETIRKRIEESIPLTNKKFAREVENARSALLVSLKNNKGAKTKKGNSSQDSFDVSGAVTDSSEEDACPNSPNINIHVEVPNLDVRQEETARKSRDLSPKAPETTLRKVDSIENHLDPNLEVSNCTSENEKGENTPPVMPVDTRISERIKLRPLLSSRPDYCDNLRDCPNHDSPRKSCREESYRPMLQRGENVINQVLADRDTYRVPPKLTSAKVPFNQRDADTKMFLVHPKNCGCNHDFNYAKKTELPVPPPCVPQRNVKAKGVENKAKNAQVSKEKIPLKPKATLRSVKSSKAPSSEHKTTECLQEKVSCYDASTKFTSSLKLSNCHVEKINEDSVILSPATSEVDYYEKMKQRDKDAQVRALKAYEKEKVRRDYDDLLRKLPVLQRQERLHELHKDRPEYHMPPERLEEQHRKKQNRIDSTYEKLFPQRQPAVVTLPKRSMEYVSESGAGGDVTPDLNVADLDPVNIVSSKEMEAILQSTNAKTRSEQLKDVLERLKKQKEQLLKEIGDVSSPQIDLEESQTRTEKLLSPRLKHKTKKREHKRSKSSPTSSSVKESSSTERHHFKREKRPKSAAPKETRGKDPKMAPKATKPEKKTPHIDSRGSTATNSKDSKVPPTKKREETRKRVLESPETSTSSQEETSSVTEKRSKTPKKRPKPCESCDKEIQVAKSDVCEIVIKVKNPNSDVAVHRDDLKSPKTKRLQTSETYFEVRSEKRPQQQPSKTSNNIGVYNIKSTSWSQELSKNNSTSSSTTYLSPPNVKLDQPTIKPSDFGMSELGKKPQQRNIHGDLSSITSFNQNEVDTRIVSQIQRLISMSRFSIDELGVSSISEVSTPAESIVGIETNKANVSNVSVNQNETETDSAIENYEKSTVYQALGFPQYADMFRNTPENVETKPDSLNPERKFLEIYAKIADSCSQRISSLTQKIERVKEEKNRIITHAAHFDMSQNNMDNSTAYLKLPFSPNTSKNNESDSSANEVDKYLLAIDMSLAQKLKESKLALEEQNIEDELAKRWAKLKEPSNEELVPKNNKTQNSSDKKHATTQKDLKNAPSNEKKDSSTETTPIQAPKVQKSPQDFVPMLLDIPKLPKLVIPTNVNTSAKRSKKPPPSKGLIAARKFKDIPSSPHELSTIPEGDSQSRIDMLETATMSSLNTTDNGDFGFAPLVVLPNCSSEEQIKQNANVPRERVAMSAQTDAQSVNVKMCNKSMTKDSFVQANDSTTSTSTSQNSTTDDVELDRLEKMLKSIGMEWAIPTIRKTQDALALTSSSSSMDLNASPLNSSKNRINLSDLLARHQVSKLLSSTTLPTEQSQTSFGESMDISNVNSNSFLSLGKTLAQKTSTPIQSSGDRSKSTVRKDSNFSYSDLSTVSKSTKSGANNGAGESFYSVSEPSM